MERFGKYEVLREIGKGGFGVVYEARDPHLRRPVAIKTCLTDDPKSARRFNREAAIAASLQHRNITMVYDYGTKDEVAYLVQEHLSGEDLSVKIERGDQLPLATKLLYLIQIARGLGYAHGQGVVHRDIKPSNIRILGDGTVKIMDFGIAKARGFDTSLTASGEAFGTPAYLSPEQIRSEKVDHRTDI